MPKLEKKSCLKTNVIVLFEKKSTMTTNQLDVGKGWGNEC